MNANEKEDSESTKMKILAELLAISIETKTLLLFVLEAGCNSAAALKDFLGKDIAYAISLGEAKNFVSSLSDQEIEVAFDSIAGWITGKDCEDVTHAGEFNLPDKNDRN
jgi:hypothetical protein